MTKDFMPLQIKHYLVFVVANEKFAIDIRDIESIHTSTTIGRFDAMEDLKTAVRLHKRVVPIINMREQLHLKGENPLQPSLLFIKHKEETNVSIVGLQVDQALEIVEVMVPKKPNGRPPRLIKAIIGFRQEIVMVLRSKDILKEAVVAETHTWN